MKNTEKLAGFVRSVMIKKNLSTYDIQKASHNRITAATVTKIVNNEIRSSGIETLAALADGLGVSQESVLRAARGLPPDAPTDRFEMYAEMFDAEFTPDEWLIMEDYFRQHVNKWKELKAEHRKFIASQHQEKPKLAPVVARIEPGKTTRADVQQMIDGEKIKEIERRVTLRKKKAK